MSVTVRNLKTSTENRKPYGGHVRSLVIAIDVGTTFSGVSYAILEPGEIPKIHGVTRFPGQEHVAGNSKIPSVVYYDKHGKMMAAGAEADTTAVISQAEDYGWIKAELFKLRLRPRTMKLSMNGMRLGPLPKRKTAVHVFGDFLAYLYQCTRVFITDTHGNGAALWNAVEHNIQFVLSHPNGWEGAQQTKMRRAAVYGNLIPDTNEGKARIRFVTEGEASLHACVLNGLAADVLSNPSKHGFLIADAGGGTLDISAYAILGTSPLVMEEIAPPDCIFAGSVFVSRRAREFLEEKLKNSRYGTPDALDHITQRFDETTKRLFRDRKDLQFIPFGSPLDKDPLVGIRGGQLKLTGDEVADLFEPSINAAFNAIKAQIDASQGVIRSVFLVGGYAASPWLFSQLQELLAPFNITISRPDTQTSKAVADGAIGFYCDHHVSARMAKFMYGVEFLRELDPRDPDHVARQGRLCELPSGPKLLPDAFDCILSRAVKVKESTVFTRKYCTELTSLAMLSVFEVEIWCYRGGNVIPKWIIRQADDFSTLCVVRADLSPLSGSAEAKIGANGKRYWTIVFSVEIHFGLTEFKARIKWVDDGKTKYGPASIVYNERGHRAEEEEPDVFPEDDVGPPPEPRNRLRSEPVSRALTPTDHYFTSGNAERSQRASIVEPPKVEPKPAEVPEVIRDRTPSTSRGFATSSTPFPTNATQDLSRSLGVEKESDVKGKGKEKTPKATPKSTPKIGDTLNSIWGANPATNPPSPIPPSPLSLALDGPKTPQLASSAHTPKGKDRKKSLDTSSSKPSPSILANRSPLGTTEPIVEQPVEQPIEQPAEPSAEPPTAPVETLAEAHAVEALAEAPVEAPSEAPAEAAAQPPAEIPAASPGPGPGGLTSSQVASPATSKKKKKGAAKGSSPAVDTKTAQSSSLPTAAATPIVAAAAETQLADTSSQPPTETQNPNPVLGTTDTTSPAAPPAPAPKSLSNVLAPVDLPNTTINVATIPGTADTNLTLDASTADSLLSPPKNSSLFGSSTWDNPADTANTELTSPSGWGSVKKTPKTQKTPKVGASPRTPWGNSPAKSGGFGFGGIGSGSASPNPPSATPAKSPWGASLGLSAQKSTLDTKPESLGEPSKPADLSKSATQEHADDTPMTSGPPATEPSNLLGGTNVNPDTTALSIAEDTVSSPKPSPKPTPTVEGGPLKDAVAETPPAVTEPTIEQAAIEHPVPTSKNPSPKHEPSAIEDTTNPTGELSGEVQPDVAAAETSAETTTEPKTPGDAISPLTDNDDGPAGGGDEEEKDEKEELGDTKGAKKGKGGGPKKKNKKKKAGT